MNPRKFVFQSILVPMQLAIRLPFWVKGFILYIVDSIWRDYISWLSPRFLSEKRGDFPPRYLAKYIGMLSKPIGKNMKCIIKRYFIIAFLRQTIQGCGSF